MKNEYSDLLKKSFANRTLISGKTRSMYPCIKPGDKLTIELKKRYVYGDIVAYLVSKRIIVHRVVWTKGEKLITKGDNVKLPDKPISQSSVLGKITEINDIKTNKMHINFFSKIKAFFSIIEGKIFLRLSKYKKNILSKNTKISNENKKFLDIITKEGNNDLDNELIKKISYFELEGIIYNKIKNSKIKKKLTRKHKQYVIQELSLESELIQLSKEFKKNKIKFILLKGISISKHYPNNFLRFTKDLDFLVDEKDLKKIENSLFDDGYVYSSIHSKSYQWFIGFHYPYLNKGKKILLEIHWNIIPKVAPIKIEDNLLKQNLKTIKISNQKINILNDRLLVYYLCINFIHPNFFSKSLKFFYDLSKIIKKLSSNDWRYILKQSVSQRTSFYLYYCFYYMKKTIGVEVPSFVLRRLESNLSLAETITVKIFNENYLLSCKKTDFLKKVILHFFLLLMTRLSNKKS